jgi:hypothetical protein
MLLIGNCKIIIAVLYDCRGVLLFSQNLANNVTRSCLLFSFKGNEEETRFFIL